MSQFTKAAQSYNNIEYSMRDRYRPTFGFEFPVTVTNFGSPLSEVRTDIFVATVTENLSRGDLINRSTRSN